MTDAPSLRIAVLIDHVEADYHTEIICGVLRSASAARVRTLVVAGGWLGHLGGPPMTRNFVYDLLERAAVDGLVLLAGSLSNYSGLPRFNEWVAQFSRIPSVSIGVELPSLPTVRADNEHGVYAVVSHLIEKHKRHRIAMLRGPVGAMEAEARLRAYGKALTDHGLALDERLIVQAGLDRHTGMAAAAQLLGHSRTTVARLDAIVAVNDEVAQGALEELKRRDIRVPEQVAVVGFDDSISASSTTPPLTTVKQQVELQGYTAAQHLIEALLSGSRPKSTLLRSEMVLRASCGCVAPLASDTRNIGSGASVRVSYLSLMNERKPLIAAELARTAAGRMLQASGWEARLIDALVRDVVTPDSKLVRAFEILARRQVSVGASMMACHDVLTTLRFQALSCTVSDRDSRSRLEDLFQEVRLVLARMGVDVEKHRQGVLNLRLRIITRACQALVGSGTLEELGKVLEEQLPALGIRSFSVACFEDESLRTLVPIAKSSRGLWRPQSPGLPAESLGLDPVLEQEGVIVIEPLEFEATPLGIAAFGWGAETPAHYEQLREALSQALFSAKRAPRGRARAFGVVRDTSPASAPEPLEPQTRRSGLRL